MAQTQQNEFTTKVRKNFISYPYDYYAGQSVRIFFGHVWVDDIITLQYSMNQNKAPIFGYASQKFDAVARGQLIINGNFTIAFKETGYLNLIHNELKNIKGTEKNKNEILQYWLGKNKPIEQILDELYMSESSSKSDFEDLSEALEDYIWQDFGKTGRQITRPDEFDYEGDGIDINGFDIVMTFGDYSDDGAEHTVKTINDVHIIGESMVLTPDGSPIGLNYTFFARSIDESISNVFKIPEEKLATSETSNPEINDKIDATYADSWDAFILEAWSNDVTKITSLTGKSFINWLSNNVKSDSALYNIDDKLKTTNINNNESLKSLRSDIKNVIQNTLNSINFENENDGLYGSAGYNIQIIKIDLKLNYNDYIGYTPENSEEIDAKLQAGTRSLEPVQFKLVNGVWSDFSNDDEYNMRNSGLTDANNLPKFSRGLGTDDFEMYSQNERDAEIKSSANLNELKKIYSTESKAFLKETVENDDFIAKRKAAREKAGLGI